MSMFKKFINLEYKQFFRSSYWQKSLALNILLGFFALYLLASFLVLGFAVYPLLKEKIPDKDPFIVVNHFLIYVFLIDLIIRYFLQNLPKLSVKPFFVLPVKRSQITHYLLGKSTLSFFNFLPAMFYIPFSIMLIINEYNILGVTMWLLGVLALTLSNNYLNILINKNSRFFLFVLSLLVLISATQYFGWYDWAGIFGQIVYGFYQYPISVSIPIVVFLLCYYLAYRTLKQQLYLDFISEKKQFATDEGLSWLDRFGQKSIFLRNDIRLIRRNKRPKMVFIMSFMMVLYGLMFFNNPIYMKKTPFMLIFVVVFMSGAFTLNFGQFVPAWDSRYYNFFMSQNFKYREYLEAKWLIMTIMTILLFILSTPYLYFGGKILLLLLVGAVFNLGFISYLVLFFGAYNRKAIDLDKSAMLNYQGTSAMQFLMVFFIMIVPMLIYGLANYIWGFDIAIGIFFVIGIMGLAFKKPIMNFIEKKYITNKYKTISAFKNN